VLDMGCSAKSVTVSALDLGLNSRTYSL